MPLRLLARAAPFVIGAVAAALWLRWRRAERPALAVETRSPAALPPPREAPAPRAPERRSVDIVTVVDDLLGATR